MASCKNDFLCTLNSNYLKEDHCSYRRNFCSCEKKAWKKIQACTGFEPWPLQYRCSTLTTRANRPVGRRSLNWFIIEPWKDNDEVMNIWKSYRVYEKCGVKNYVKEDHHSYRRNFCSCKKKAWKKNFSSNFLSRPSEASFKKLTQDIFISGSFFVTLWAF